MHQSMHMMGIGFEHGRKGMGMSNNFLQVGFAISGGCVGKLIPDNQRHDQILRENRSREVVVIKNHKTEWVSEVEDCPTWNLTTFSFE